MFSFLPQQNKLETFQFLIFVYMSGCDASSTNTGFQCPNHKRENTANQLPLALRSLPSEVELCASSIPGTGIGICAKRAFPVGAWIGLMKEHL